MPEHHHHHSMCVDVSAADKGRLTSAVYEAPTLHSYIDQSYPAIPYRLIVICRKHRQKRNVTLIVLEASLQWLNLVFYVVPNILNLADPCYFLADDWFYLGFARWTCWNTVSHHFLKPMQSHLRRFCILHASMSFFREAVVLQGFSRCKTVLPCIQTMRLQVLAVIGVWKLHSFRLMPQEASRVLAGRHGRLVLLAKKVGCLRLLFCNFVSGVVCSSLPSASAKSAVARHQSIMNECPLYQNTLWIQNSPNFTSSAMSVLCRLHIG